MVSTIDLMAEHQAETGLSGELFEEEVAFLYVGMRLKPILSAIKITHPEFDYLCDDIVQAYVEDDYTLDCLINAVYNYINKNKTYPPCNCFNDGIEIFLKEYCKAIEDFTKKKRKKK